MKTNTMKTRMIKVVTVISLGTVMFGVAAAGPALADGRCRDNCPGPGIRVSVNTGGRYFDRDGRNHRLDRGRIDRRDDRR